MKIPFPKSKAEVAETAYESIFKISDRLRNYFRLEVAGLENIASNDGALIIPNHSGFMGFDAVMIKNIFRRDLDNKSLALFAHRFYFELNQIIKRIVEKFEMHRAGFNNGIKVLESGQSLLLFPEAEAGNFKSSLQKYQLQRFHTGFARLAILSNAPVVPCLVMGAEESNFNIGNIDFSRFVKNFRFPLPLNPMPLPAKWKIRFLKARTFNEDPIRAYQSEVLQRICRDLREEMQYELNLMLKNRPSVYF